MDYLVRLDSDDSATITKWDGGYILQEYRLTKKKTWRCNCPVGRYHSCKHIDMLHEQLPLQSKLKII